jgi:hypothetical protein
LTQAHPRRVTAPGPAAAPAARTGQLAWRPAAASQGPRPQRGSAPAPRAPPGARPTAHGAKADGVWPSAQRKNIGTIRSEGTAVA